MLKTKKLILLTIALIGAQAHFSYTYAPIDSATVQFYYNTEFTVEADIFYRSTYVAGPDSDDNNIEGYGF